MTTEDLAQHSRAVADEREAADAIEAWRSAQGAEIRATRRPPSDVRLLRVVGGLPWSADWATLRAPSTNDYRRTQIAHRSQPAANPRRANWSSLLPVAGPQITVLVGRLLGHHAFRLLRPAKQRGCLLAA